MLRSLYNKTIAWLFPSFCLLCRRRGPWLCIDCQSTLGLQPHFLCLCTKPTKLTAPGRCPRCAQTKLSGLINALSYENKKVQRVLYCFKYEPLLRELAKPLAQLIFDQLRLAEYQLPANDYILVPMPLHRRRLKWRGFNQAELLAKELCILFGYPLISNCLVRTKATKPQVNLTKQQRLENLRGAFALQNAAALKAKNVLLIDAVYTSGASMQEAARILLNNGAHSVLGLVLARQPLTEKDDNV